MQTLGMKYETIGGGSLVGAAAYASLASFKFRNKSINGLPYLLASLGHFEESYASRGAELKAVESARVAIKSLSDRITQLPFDALQALAEQIALLPEVEGLPQALEGFLVATKWPNEIRSVEHQTRYGFQWIATVIAAVGAVIGLVASVVQLSGSGELADVFTSSITAYFLLAISLFGAAVLIEWRMAQYGVEMRDVDALEKEIIEVAGAPLGKRTSLRTLSLIPEIMLASFAIFFAVDGALVVIGILILSAFDRAALQNIPAAFLPVGLGVFIPFSILSWVTVRHLRREFRPKTEKR
jgi:hypothetical protein